MSTTTTTSTIPVLLHNEPPTYTKSTLPTYSERESVIGSRSTRQPTSTPLSPQSPDSTSLNQNLPSLSLPPATQPETGATSLELPSSSTTSPILAPTFSTAISIHSVSSVRDFAHPPDSPQHVTPSPTIEPSETRRPGPRRAYSALPSPGIPINADDLPAYSSGQRARRQIFKSEDDYLAALSAWAEEKLYSDVPKDSKGRSVGISGFYGTMSSSDYVAREERRRGGPNVGKAKTAASAGASDARKRESGATSAGSNERTASQQKEGLSRARTIETPLDNAEDVGSSSAGPGESGRRSSIAQWMRKKKIGSGS